MVREIDAKGGGGWGAGGIETRRPRGGMEGPAEAVPQRVTERNVSEAE